MKSLEISEKFYENKLSLTILGNTREKFKKNL